MDDAVAELHHAADLGLHLVSLPTGVPEGVDDWHYDSWEPLWAAAEDTGMVLGFHIGSDGTAAGPTVFRGPGGAVLNYVETTYGGQKVATKLVASRARSTGTPTCACSSRKAARRGCRSSAIA